MTKSVMKDARLRGNFNKWLDKQATSRWNSPGMDPNRPRQYMNSALGYLNQSQRPNQVGGEPYQNRYRNRANEQPGLPTPTPPATARPPVGPRR